MIVNEGMAMLTRLSCRIARRRRFSWFSTTLVFFKSSDPRLLVRVSDSCGGREGGREGEPNQKEEAKMLVIPTLAKTLCLFSSSVA